MARIVALPNAPAAADSELLSVILREVLALRSEVAALGVRSSVAGDAVLAGLLAAIYAAIGDRVFSAGDLLIHAALPIAADLHAAIIVTVGAANARKIGKALARIEGRDLGGLRVIRIDADSTGILWSVRRVS